MRDGFNRMLLQASNNNIMEPSVSFQETARGRIEKAKRRNLKAIGYDATTGTIITKDEETGEEFPIAINQIDNNFVLNALADLNVYDMAKIDQSDSKLMMRLKRIYVNLLRKTLPASKVSAELQTKFGLSETGSTINIPSECLKRLNRQEFKAVIDHEIQHANQERIAGRNSGEVVDTTGYGGKIESMRRKLLGQNMNTLAVSKNATTEWIKQYLNSPAGKKLEITHDRYLFELEADAVAVRKNGAKVYTQALKHLYGMQAKVLRDAYSNEFRTSEAEKLDRNIKALGKLNQYMQMYNGKIDDATLNKFLNESESTVDKISSGASQLFQQVREIKAYAKTHNIPLNYGSVKEIMATLNSVEKVSASYNNPYTTITAARKQKLLSLPPEKRPLYVKALYDKCLSARKEVADINSKMEKINSKLEQLKKGYEARCEFCFAIEQAAPWAKGAIAEFVVFMSKAFNISFTEDYTEVNLAEDILMSENSLVYFSSYDDPYEDLIVEMATADNEYDYDKILSNIIFINEAALNKYKEGIKVYSEFSRGSSLLRAMIEAEEVGTTEDFGMPEEIQPIDDDLDIGASNDGAPIAPQTGITAIDVDISTFGSDNSDVHNEYDPKEIERLNILIASENSAIGEYFTAAKETNIDVLRRLYSDIGEEERFHSEQLIFAKSQITGETYVPRDPDVKAEYEKLLDMGMDEETAMTTAVDKVGLMNRERTVTPEEEAQQREDLIEDMEVVEYSMYQEYLIFNMMTSPRIKDLYEHDSAIRNYCESYIDTAVELTPQIFVEAVVDSSSLPANKQKVLPDLLGSIARLIKNAIKAIKTMGQKFTQFWVNMRETRKHYASWLKNHSIKEIFAKGFSLYLWDDNKNDFDFDDPAAFIKLLNSATKTIAEEFGIVIKDPHIKFTMATNKTINVSSVDEAIQIVKNAKFVPTKIVLNENNEQTILTNIFGITSAKLDNERESAAKSMNGYNSFEALVSDCNAYLENANRVLTQLNQLKGKQGGEVQSDPEKFNTAIKQMKDIANGYTKWINIINHDMTAMMKINNDLAAQIKAATEVEDINASVGDLQKGKATLQRELTRLEAEKAKNPNNSTVLKAISETKNKIAKIDAQLNRATREPQTPAKASQDQGAPAESPEGQGEVSTDNATQNQSGQIKQEDASRIEQIVQSGDPTELIKMYYQLYDKVNGR